jgi:rhodanese-related sulfurtransferase
MQTKQCLKTGLAIMVILLISFSQAIASPEFPLREKYSQVPFITIEDLEQDYEKVIIVDVRSKLEYETVHINKALNIAISKATFGKELEKVRGKTGDVPLVFYCNGHTCSKSYKATKKAMSLGFKNVYAFDAGIFDWIKTYPEKGTLLGQTPAPKEKIIPKTKLKEKMLDYAEFKTKAEKPNTMVIDIREPFQRDKIPPLSKVRNIPSDRLRPLVEAKKFKDKLLLIFDATGKQVRWLQYQLESNGYQNYYFLKGGVFSL